jgi:hypothetical protein
MQPIRSVWEIPPEKRVGLPEKQFLVTPVQEGTFPLAKSSNEARVRHVACNDPTLRVFVLDKQWRAHLAKSSKEN